MRTLYFLLVVTFLIAYTFYKSFELLPSQPLLALVLAVTVFAVMLAGMFVYRSRPQVFNQLWFKALTWTASISMALWATYIIISFPFDALYLLAWGAGQAHGFSIVTPALLLVSILLTAIGFFGAITGPTTKRTDVTIDNLAPALEGLRIVQISDLHIGVTIRKKYVEEVVRRTNALNPDLIVLTGDIVDAHPSSIDEGLKPLVQLQAKYGAFYVTGNHEYYWNAPEIIRKIENTGIVALLNSNQTFTIGDMQLMVAGTTDPAGTQFVKGHKPDVKSAIHSPKTAHLKILLAHRPDACIEAEQLGFDLQFSGHTHAGQFFPFNLFIGLAHRYSRGLYRHGRMWVHVNPGTGYWGPANRLGVKSEISLITLQSQASAGE